MIVLTDYLSVLLLPTSLSVRFPPSLSLAASMLLSSSLPFTFSICVHVHQQCRMSTWNKFTIDIYFILCTSQHVHLQNRLNKQVYSYSLTFVTNIDKTSFTVCG